MAFGEPGDMGKDYEGDVHPSGDNGGREAASKLRDEAQEFDYCSKVLGPDRFNPGFCVAGNGDFVLEIPSVIGRIVVHPDKTVVQIRPDGSALHRDTDSRVTYIEYPQGGLRRFAYGEDGQLSMIEDSDGSIWRKGFEMWGLQCWMHERRDGKFVPVVGNFMVNDKGDLTFKGDGAESEYRNDGYIKKVKDGFGYQWDHNGRRVAEFAPQAYRQYEYGEEGLINTVRFVRGSVSVREADGWYTYDVYGKKQPGPLPEVYFNHDKTEDCSERCTDYSGEPSYRVERQDGRPVKINYRLGAVVKLGYDADGRLNRVEQADVTTYRRDQYMWDVYTTDATTPTDRVMWNRVGLDWLEEQESKIRRRGK